MADESKGDFVLHAWADESMRAPRDGHDGLYLIAAAIADPTRCGEVRDSLRTLTRTRDGRLHWRDESTAQRRKIAAAIAEQDLAHIVVVGTPLDSRRQERARAICMERLLHELDGLGVVQVWLENRHRSLNKRDVRLIDVLRIRGAISDSIVVGFALPKEDAMLWVPDAIAGAVSAARSGHDTDILDEVGAIEMIDVTLT